MNEDTISDNERLRMRITQYTDWAVKGLIAASFIFIWKMYLAQQEFIQKQAVLDVRVSQLEKDQARIEGSMVTIETLKRVELYMELVLRKQGFNDKVDLTSGAKK
jgi:hypothetical protein